MLNGAETPLSNSALAGAQPGKGRAVFALKNNALSGASGIREQVLAQAPQIEQGVTQTGEVTFKAVESNITPQNFQQVIKEFQERFSDEDRIPPSIFKQMKDLLESALEGDSKPSFNKLA